MSVDELPTSFVGKCCKLIVTTASNSIIIPLVTTAYVYDGVIAPSVCTPLSLVVHPFHENLSNQIFEFGFSESATLTFLRFCDKHLSKEVVKFLHNAFPQSVERIKLEAEGNVHKTYAEQIFNLRDERPDLFAEHTNTN